MAITTRTENLTANHAVSAIDGRLDVFVGDGLEKTWPTGAGIELRIRGKERETATDAGINSVRLIVEQRAAEGPLSSLGAGDGKLLGRQLFTPLGIGFD